ncbi:ParA family protein [Acinetobacter sp. B51(2017)]|uniref:ParA family protein n=1 Tax=Acinetobacter sp. B51(2017) TaxID=2060938 RepID=UPI000F0908B5|nr:ParA family protein [Acinetobacter sp. B51(2017)]
MNGNQALKTAIAQNKGGVGKTTITVNVAVALAARGYQVLVVDLDAQCNATNHISVVPAVELSYSVADFFDDYKKFDPSLAILKDEQTRFINISLLPSSKRIGDAARNLQRNSPIPNEILSRILGRIEADYDFILVDCPPEIETLTFNALVAVNNFILPAQGQYSIEGFEKILDAMDSLDRINPELKILCPVLNFFKKNQLADKNMKEQLEEEFTTVVLEQRVIHPEIILIPQSAVFEQAAITKMSIYDLAPSKAAAVEAIDRIVDLLEQQYQQQKAA